MHKIIIIKIQEGTFTPGGHVIQVWANPVVKSPSFSYVLKTFGRVEYQYAQNKTDDTMMFVFPYSNEMMEQFLDMARNRKYWEPDLDEFHFARVSMQNGETRSFLKSNLFKKRIPECLFAYYTPPQDIFDFRHRIIDGNKCLIFPATQATEDDIDKYIDEYLDIDDVTKAEEKSLRNEGQTDFFVFPDNAFYWDKLNDLIPHYDFEENNLWNPDLSLFCRHIRVNRQELGKTTLHNLYISNNLPPFEIQTNMDSLLEPTPEEIEVLNNKARKEIANKLWRESEEERHLIEEIEDAKCCDRTNGTNCDYGDNGYGKEYDDDNIW